jgi:hypothetical protein
LWPNGIYEYNPGLELVFTQPDEPEKRPTSMTARLIKASTDPQSTKPVKVRVAERRRVVHDGHAYVAGDEATVPEHAAKEWERVTTSKG